MARVLVPIAEGSEEIEAVTIIDVLRRAEADVTVASVMPSAEVRASRGVVLGADCLLEDCVEQHWDLIALPGGMPGAEHLGNSEALIDLLRAQLQAARWVAAICAAPAVVLGRNGLIGDYRATCHSGYQGELAQQVQEVSSERVVLDRNLITSQAPGTAMEFALELVECLFDTERASTVAEPMAVRR